MDKQRIVKNLQARKREMENFFAVDDGEYGLGQEEMAAREVEYLTDFLEDIEREED